MNQILEWLAGSDLRSDGMSNEVAEFVLKTPDILGDLLEGLREGDDPLALRLCGMIKALPYERE